jgi:23S rRNA (adenine2503-C2)-methyltransferase
MGFRRQLTPAEIAGQALAAVECLGLEARTRNLVFMGMGEPLSNYFNLLKAINILTDDLGLNYSLRRITVSTCGLIPEMLRLGEDTDVGLAVSLHASDSAVREKIMPINRRYPLPELLDACRRYSLSPRRRITFEYLLLAGINDSPGQARQLAEILKGIPSKINLIPCNESPDMPFGAPSEDRIVEFREILAGAGYAAIVRKSRGRDISAACGQLFAELAAA